jgi:hypothetical protein
MLTNVVKGAVAGAAGLGVVGLPLEAKVTRTSSGLWLPRLGLSVAGAQDVDGVPSYILPPITVYAGSGGVLEGGDIGTGFNLNYNSYTNGYGGRIYQAVLRQRALAALQAEQQRQRDEIAARWTALYDAWLLQFGPDASRLATELEWRGLNSTQVIATIGVLEAAAGAIEAGAYLMTNKGTWSFIGEGMRGGGLIATIAGLSVGFYVVLSGVAALAVGLGLIYIVVQRMNTAEVGTNYVGLRPVAVPDGSADIIIDAP